MNTLIAKKIGMTQIFDEDSNALGVTVLDVSDCRVVQVKNSQKDGYDAVQLTIGSKKKLSKPLESHYKKYKLAHVSNEKSSNFGNSWPERGQV